MTGAFNPSPLKTGAEQGHVEEALLDYLVEADGTALSPDVDSFVWAEHLAESRAIAYLWHTNQKMANQWDPRRMTDFLPRWEKILGIVPLPRDNDVDRRAKVKAKLETYGEPGTQQVIQDVLTTVLGDVFVSIVNSPSSIATGYVTGGVTIPGGVTLPDGTPFGESWYSTIAYLAIETQKPSGFTDSDFYDAVGQISQFLDGLVPGWVTYDWFLDGGSGAGFYLDDDFNLDNQRFD